MSAIRTLLTALAVLAAGLGLVPPLPAQSPQPQVVTFDKLRELLTLEVKEEKLLRLIEDSPTVFTLGADQESELRKAGASDRLIAALKARVSAPAKPGDVSAFVLILDVSGSMRDQDANGVPKWTAAKKAALDLIESIPAGRELAFIVYGHDLKRACQAVDVVLPMTPLKPLTKVQLHDYIQTLAPTGHTPIALALQKAGKELAKTTALAKVILITDGMETCHGDPAKAAAALAAMTNVTGVDVVGLGLEEKEVAAVGTIAEKGKGKFYDAKTAKDLYESIRKIKEAMPGGGDKAAQKPADEPAGEPLNAGPALAAVKTIEADTKPSTDPKTPAPLELGKVVGGRLAVSRETGKSHYWRIDLPAGEYKAVLDAKRADGRISNVMGRLSWGPMGETNLRGLVTLNVLDSRTRGVASFQLKQDASVLLRFENDDSIIDYQLGVFKQTDEFSRPFFRKCPPVRPITVGRKITCPALGGSDPARCDEYFQVTLPAGDYHFALEVAALDGMRPLDCGISVLTSDGVMSKSNFVWSTVTDPQFQKSAKVVLADEVTVLLRVRSLTKCKVSFQVDPVKPD